MRVALLTAAALTGFAANSLLTRSALGAGWLDAPSFTIIRLVTGALTLALLVGATSRVSGAAPRRGSWAAAAALAGYAIAFTVAYTRIGAGVGALLLFGGWYVLSARKWFKGPIRMGTDEELERYEEELETRTRTAPATGS